MTLLCARRLIPCLLITLLPACAVQLEPDYEEPIVQGLNNFNAAIQSHFASVADGSDVGITDAERASYDALEGDAKALIMLVESRPQPTSPLARWFGEQASDKIEPDGTTSQVAFLDVPTDDQLREILARIIREGADFSVAGVA